MSNGGPYRNLKIRVSSEVELPVPSLLHAAGDVASPAGGGLSRAGAWGASGRGQRKESLGLIGGLIR